MLSSKLLQTIKLFCESHYNLLADETTPMSFEDFHSNIKALCEMAFTSGELYGRDEVRKEIDTILSNNFFQNDNNKND